MNCGGGVLSNTELLVVSMALGTDLFSVAIPIGMKSIGFRIILRAAVTFAIFHIVLILAGYHMGHFLGAIVERVGTYKSDDPIMIMENWASILGALVLAGLGIYMIKENLYASVPQQGREHPLQGFSLLVLAASVSVDALAAGFSMGMMDVNLVKLSLILGVVIFSIAVVGLRLGRQVGQCIGKRAELIGGMVLIFLGLHVLWRIIAG
jgi:putative Mn2+ efflux pump MntP